MNMHHQLEKKDEDSEKKLVAIKPMAVYGYTFKADSKQSTKIKIAKPTFFLDTGREGVD